MSKTLGSWSGMCKYLEDEILAKCLKGRLVKRELIDNSKD